MAVALVQSPTKYRIDLTREEAPQHCTYPYVLRWVSCTPGTHRGSAHREQHLLLLVCVLLTCAPAPSNSVVCLMQAEMMCLARIQAAGIDTTRSAWLRHSIGMHNSAAFICIRRGYRAGGDYKRCLQAAFELHTETFNAWVRPGSLCVAPEGSLFVCVHTSHARAHL